jgi:hypothetical protein
MRRWAATLGLAAFCFCSSALAQEADAPPPDPAKMAVATRILEETHALDNMNSTLDAMIAPLIRNIKQQSPAIPDEQLKVISDMLAEELRKKFPQIMALNAQIYASHFTLDELNAIEAFYQTPAGQKIVGETPKIMKEVLPIALAWGRQAAQEALARIVEQLRKQGVKI